MCICFLMVYTIGFKLKSLTFEELCIKCAGQFSGTPLAVWECRKPVQKKMDSVYRKTKSNVFRS